MTLQLARALVRIEHRLDWQQDRLPYLSRSMYHPLISIREILRRR
jgi:hypothetical protein